MTSPIDINFPADLDQQIEAALEGLRAALLDPTVAKKPDPARCAFSFLDQLTLKVSPEGHQYQEAGGIMSGVALNIAIYTISDMSPGDWFLESTIDIRRALVAIELLVAYGKQLDATNAQNTKADV